MRILIAHGDRHDPGASGGGAESLLRDQAQALKALGHDVAWWYGEGSIEEAVGVFQPDLLHFMTIHCYPMGMAPLVWAQEHHIPHLIHVQDYWPFCAGRMMMIGDRPCSAVTGICLHECKQYASPDYLAIVNRSYVVAGNRYTAEIYRRNGVRCDAVVELGVNTAMFAPDQSKRQAGSIYTSTAWAAMPWKGMHILEQAARGA